MQGERAELFCGLSGGKQELQEWAHATRPGLLVMLGALNLLEMKILIVLPAPFYQRVAKIRDILQSVRRFIGAYVQPDTRARLNGRWRHVTENRPLAPPHGRREHREFAENVRILQSEVNRQQTAQRRAPDADIFRFVQRAIV